MNSTRLTLRSQEQIKPESVLFTIGGFAILTGLALSLLKKPKFEITDPPPIFIKSGSFVIESDVDLNESSGASPYHYKRINFGQILGVRVFKYNEIYGVSQIPEEIDYEAGSSGLTVRIWLQRLVNNQWSNIASTPEIVARNTGNDFDLELRFAKKLDKRPKKHSLRKAKYEDKEDDIFRFGQIQVDSFTPITTGNGDEYTIGFYNDI